MPCSRLFEPKLKIPKSASNQITQKLTTISSLSMRWKMTSQYFKAGSYVRYSPRVPPAREKVLSDGVLVAGADNTDKASSTSL